MKFYTRKLIKPEDLNARNSLFGGRLLQWIDEEAGIYVMTKLGTNQVVTKFMSEIDFASSAHQGDVIEIGLQFKKVGRTSITIECEVRNLFTHKTIITISDIVFVKVDKNDQPEAHGLSKEDILKKTGE